MGAGDGYIAARRSRYRERESASVGAGAWLVPSRGAGDGPEHYGGACFSSPTRGTGKSSAKYARVVARAAADSRGIRRSRGSGAGEVSAGLLPVPTGGSSSGIGSHVAASERESDRLVYRWERDPGRLSRAAFQRQA